MNKKNGEPNLTPQQIYILKIMESELRSDFQESLLPPKPGMYAEKVATAPKAM